MTVGKKNSNLIGKKTQRGAVLSPKQLDGEMRKKEQERRWMRNGTKHKLRMCVCK